jgi:hypothetical protein
MSEGIVYSQRLGAISDMQFAAACERLALGQFVKAEPTTSGLFGQNVFVTTTSGEFVLRGAPHWVKGARDTEWRREDRWQFTKERWFARQLHERTKTPVPWPMLHDEANDIFGWPYLVMPRMPGTCFDERGILTALPPEDRRGVAVALGEMLREMQKLTSPFTGDFSQDSIALEAWPGGVEHAIAETSRMADGAQAHGRFTADDRAFLDAAAAQARAAADGIANAYVHVDYKLNNLTVAKDAGAWRVSGLFDLHEARFADGALDVVRTACSYLDTEPELARIFRDAYGKPLDPARMPLYVLNDRMKFWGYFTQPNVDAEWLRGQTFRGWTQRYVDGVLALL